MNEKIRWGILSTGKISRQFAHALAFVSDAELLAVGSRDASTAMAFGVEFNVPRRYGTYAQLVADPDVDAIYVSTPHPFHKESALMCLEAGKAVLCEKPLTVNAREAEEVVRAARRKGAFLMEAMWSRFVPAMVRARELLASGAIGAVHLLQADFGFRAMFDPKSRLFALELGGGALLDVGVYCVSLASMVFGTPSRVTGMAQLGKSGVDELSAMIFGYKGGELAVLSTALNTSTPLEATFVGAEGRLRIHAPWFKPDRLTLSRPGKGDEVISIPFEGNGYNYEVVEVHNCLRAGKTESETMPLGESLAIMKTMDDVRAQWGLKYPMERG